MKKLGKFELDRIYCGDCKDLLKQIPNKKIDMCITSPPYWGLRDYGIEGIIWDGEENCKHKWFEVDVLRKATPGDKPSVKSKVAIHRTNAENRPGKPSDFCIKCGAWKGQLGLEPDFNLYIKHLCDIFDEVKRVLKKEGTCWVNIGDTYHGGNLCVGQPENWESLSTINKEKYDSSIFNKFIKDRNKMNYPKKSLIMIPFRFAIEMVNRGWILRNVIIWHKPNCMPSSAKDRFTVDFEYLFFFSKNKKYYFEQQFESWTDKDKHDIERAMYGHKEYEGKYKSEKKGSFSFNESKVVGDPLKGRNKRTVWKIRSKYKDTEGHSDRAGLQREPTLREKRINEIIQKEIANYLKKYLTKEKRNILDKEFGKHKWPHWIRTDKSGASLPSPNDWIKLKEILGFDNKHDDIMTETEIYLDDGMMWKNKGKNKRTVWSITTKGFKEAHFAVFPPELIEIPIKAGCPEFVCKKCGKAKTKEYKVIGKKKVPPIGGIKHQANINPVYSGNIEQQIKKEIGYKTNCNCNLGFEGGIVLDPFIGSGTTGVVAIKQRKHFIGFEINPEYLEMANKRLSNIQVRML